MARARKRGDNAVRELGLMLIAKKAEIKAQGGRWRDWLAHHKPVLEFEHRMAERYMKFARDPNASLTTLWGNGKRDESDSFLFMTVDDAKLVKRAFGGKINVDVSSCAEANAKYVQAEKFYDKAKDGLKQDWLDNVFCNPMYHDVAPWVAKLLQEIEAGNCKQAITLTPASTDTEWFQDIFANASAICFPLHRVKFHQPQTGKLGNPALPSAFAYFGPNHDRFIATFEKRGAVWVPAL